MPQLAFPVEGTALPPAYAFCSFNIEYTHHADFLALVLMTWLCTLSKIPREVQDALGGIAGGRPSNVKINLQDLAIKVVRRLLQENEQSAKATGRTQNSLFFIIDALDEIPDSHREGAMAFVERLCRLNRERTASKIRIVLVSRPSSEVRYLCTQNNGWSTINVQTSGTWLTKDIEQAMLVRIDQDRRLRRLKGLDKADLAGSIAKKADGM